MTLPKLDLLPEKATYQYNINRDVVSTQLEGGLSRRRRDIAGSSSVIKCSWFLQPFQYQYFMSFYHFSVKRGANNFRIDLLLEQPYLEEMVASFIEESISMKQIGLSYEVTADLEVVPIQIDDMAELVVLLYTPEGDNNVINLLEIFVNYDLEIAP